MPKLENNGIEMSWIPPSVKQFEKFKLKKKMVYLIVTYNEDTKNFNNYWVKCENNDYDPIKILTYNEDGYFNNEIIVNIIKL